MSTVPHPVLTIGGYWGWNRQAFVFELTGGDLYNSAIKTGASRYGQPPGDKSDDKRPISQRFSPFFPTTNPNYFPPTWAPQGGSPALVSFAYSGGGAPVYSQPNASPNTPNAYLSSNFIGKNEGWTIKTLIAEKSDDQVLSLEQWWWGQAGKGALFQIRDGRPEFGWLSKDFTKAQLASLVELWSIEEPTDEDAAAADALVNVLFEEFDQISLPRDKWYGEGWTLSFIPEPRGACHLVLDGADSVQVEKPSQIEQRKAGTLWESSVVHLFSAGGAYSFQAGYPLHSTTSTLRYGPYYQGEYTLDELVNIQSTYVATYDTTLYGEGADLDEPVKVEINPAVDEEGRDLFYITVTVQTPAPRQPVWLYAMSSRIETGAREVPDFTPWSSDTASANETNPIMEVEPIWDGQGKGARVTMRNISGWTTTDLKRFIDRTASISFGGQSFLANALVVDMKHTSIKTPGASSGNEQFNGESQIMIELRDHWARLSEVYCNPPIVVDGLRLGAGIRRVLRTAGATDYELEDIDPNEGPLFGGNVAGEDWAWRFDEQILLADALNTMMDAKGLGYRVWQNRQGKWQLAKPSTTAVATYTTSGTTNNASTNAGRRTVLAPLDVIVNNDNYYNEFIVVGAGDVRRAFTRWESIRKPTSPFYIGRYKPYGTHSNDAIRDNDEAEYALRSLEWRNGRFGRRAIYETYFTIFYEINDRLSLGGATWEIEALSSGSLANDRIQFELLEVVT